MKGPTLTLEEFRNFVEYGLKRGTKMKTMTVTWEGLEKISRTMNEQWARALTRER